MVKMMTRERTSLPGRKENLSREGEGNRVDIAGLRFRLEEAENRCYRLTDKAEALRFDLKAKGEVEAEIRRAMEADA